MSPRMPTGPEDPALRGDSSPLRVLGWIWVVAFASLVAGFAVPMAVALICDVFDKEGLKKRLPEDVNRKYQQYEDSRAAKEEQIRRIESAISAKLKEAAGQRAAEPGVPADREDLPRLVMALEHLRKELNAAAPPVILSPFIHSNVMFIWPWEYFCLGCLVFLVPPVRIHHRLPDFGRTALVALPAFLLYRWPSWLRNTIWTQERRVYADVNFDISPASWATQEVMTFAVFYLLAMLWRQWGEVARITRTGPRAEFDPEEAVYDPGRLEGLSRTFVRWQVMSVVLAAAFIG